MHREENFPPVFADPVIENKFTRDGYAVLPFFNEAEVAACRKLYFDTMTEPPADFFTTGFLPDGEPRRKVKEGLEEIIAPHVAALLPTYSTCVRHFIVKRGRPDASLLRLHQDFNFVDHSLHRAVHVWIALADVDERNGCLTVLPGSHRLTRHISAMGVNATPYDPYRQVLEDDCKVGIPMRAGEALFFDERTLHGSYPNTSPHVRIAMGAVFLPKGVKQRLYVADDEKSAVLDVLEVESETLLNYNTVLRPPYPEGFTKIGTVEYTAQTLSPEVVQSLRRAPAKADPIPPSGPIPPALPGNKRESYRDDASPDSPSSLRDLDPRGYAMEPFLSPGDIQALAELHRRTTPIVPSDYYVTAFGGDPAVRRTVFQGIANIVEGKVRILAPGYRILMASFVTKRARSTQGRLPLHQDYSLVDHDKHLGLNVWIPLCDVDNRNGCLRVVEGSQAFGHISANPPNPEPYRNVRGELDSAHYLVDLPMAAGHAFLFDTRVLHATDENATDSDRTSVILNLVPENVAARLYQWNCQIPGKLEVYEVDSEFLLRMPPNTYVENPVRLGAKFVGLIDYTFEPLTSADLPLKLNVRRPAGESSALLSPEMARSLRRVPATADPIPPSGGPAQIPTALLDRKPGFFSRLFGRS